MSLIAFASPSGSGKTTLLNLIGSFNLIPGLVYSPVTNLQLRARSVGLCGGQGTGYGEKQNDYRLDLRVRYFEGA